jgi:hypothetical protein
MGLSATGATTTWEMVAPVADKQRIYRMGLSCLNAPFAKIPGAPENPG